MTPHFYSFPAQTLFYGGLSLLGGGGGGGGSRYPERPSPLADAAMRHHGWLLRACALVLLFLMFVTKFISYKAVNDYGEVAGVQNWTLSGHKVAKLSMPTSGKTLAPQQDQSSASPATTEWEGVLAQRIQLLSTVCKDSQLRNSTHVPISKFVLDRIFVCDKHSILFCQTPKVGNTQWKKVLIALNGTYSSVEEIPENLVHDHEKNGLPRLSSFKPQEVALRLNSYFKFFIVRDPFERLISAFKDKFIKNPRFEPWYKHDIAPAIIRKYRKSHRDSGLSASGLHFEDFVRYLGDTEGRRRMDRQFGEHIIHWVTYAELCAPCDIRYDVIGHHETLERDAAHILRRAAIDHLVSYPAIPPGITRYNKTKVERYFSGISKRDIRRLYERFEGDFHLFGYPTPDFLLL
ncbi:carbohydrate sulfotransferase 10 isoform X1 [Nerophis ophidion]|uniref:carbohydrate sulfotransferase 10 isoform X1 n=2 Tax=Nerophis ophidion TaxID=159077 RepID=UPI002ADFEBBC|nr:carbohydrate sulfotransferase 10 isoform X1 [Nerophis ophidion]XP_061745017.1 carbohydrate sulfotransferase 10 isoform X1 [Nerophis ophidion]